LGVNFGSEEIMFRRTLILKAVQTGLFLLIDRPKHSTALRDALDRMPGSPLESAKFPDMPSFTTVATPPPAAPAEAPRLVEAAPASEYSGLSQLSAAGKACIPCGNDHFSTTAGALAEAIRFAKKGGVADPEVVSRLSLAKDELNAFERIDGSPEKVVALPSAEKEIMDDMLEHSRALRHEIDDIGDAADLERVAAQARNNRVELLARTLRLKIEGE
jgi:hypothetical protein